MTFQDLLKRAQSIIDEIRRDSITPQRMGELLRDILNVSDKKINTLQSDVDKQLQEQDADFAKKAAEEFARNKEYVDNKSIEILPGAVTPETLSESTKQLISTSGGGSVTNLADDEDLESINNVIKFKDRRYNPAAHSGLGYKRLRKNINPQGKNILIQDMIDQTHTSYEITYDYDLDGQTITMPAGCTLHFNGGCLSNGKIVGNLTRIEAGIMHIFNEIKLTGAYVQEYIYPEWFGAVGYYSKCTIDQNENITVGSTALNIPEEVDSLPDSSEALNNALDLSTLSGGVVRCQNLIYKVENPINIRTRATLELPTDSILVPYMTGDGLRVITQDEGNGDMVTAALTAPPVALGSNQIFHTDSMMSCINISSIRAALIGGGTISMVRSVRTIGVAVKSMGYQYDDMNYLSPTVDVKIIAGNHTENSPNIYDTTGTGAPTDASANTTGSDIYYYDQSSGSIYRKSKGSNGWSIWGNPGDAKIPRWNTGLRFCIESGWSGGRIVNPRIKVGISFGARGIEVFANGGDWFNESVAEGSVSYMYSHYISVFVPLRVCVTNHYWDKVIMQNKLLAMEDSSIFYAIACGVLNLGYCWDLSWLGSNRKRAFYLGRYTSGISLGNVDNPLSSVVNYGANNNYVYSPNNELSDSDIKSMINSNKIHNILKYNSFGVLRGNSSNSPNYRLKYRSHREISDVSTFYSRLHSAEYGAEENRSIDSCVFDEDYRTSATVVDSNNGIYGTSVSFEVMSTSSSFQQGRFCRAVMIEYRVEGVSLGDENMRNIYVALSFNNNERYTQSLYRSKVSTASGVKKATECAVIRIRNSDQLYTPVLSFYTDRELANAKLKIVNIKLLTDTPANLNTADPYYNFIFPSSGALLSGPSARRPTAAPKGYVFYDTTLSKPVINIGDSSVGDWKILPLNIYNDKGSTSQRPALTASDSGFQYYDTALKKYICWSGTAWINLDGSSLT